MRRTLLAVSVGLLACAISGPYAGVQAATPAKVWESTKAYGPECVYHDANAGVLYVTNGNNDATKKDGDGYVSKHALDGTVITEKWATGLSAPKGMAVSNGHLFVADVDELVEIDLKDGRVIAKHKAPGAKLINDVAVDSSGAVYTSDTMGNAIFRYADGKIESWLAGDTMAGPNGLIVEGDNLIVNTWGVLSGDGWATSTPGQLYSVSLTDKSIKPLGKGKPFGNLDALQPLGSGSYLVGDFWAGKVLKFEADGTVSEVLSLTQGTADFGYNPATKTIFVPNMMANTITAYKLP